VWTFPNVIRSGLPIQPELTTTALSAFMVEHLMLAQAAEALDERAVRPVPLHKVPEHLCVSGGYVGNRRPEQFGRSCLSLYEVDSKRVPSRQPGKGEEMPHDVVVAGIVHQAGEGVPDIMGYAFEDPVFGH